MFLMEKLILRILRRCLYLQSECTGNQKKRVNEILVQCTINILLFVPRGFMGFMVIIFVYTMFRLFKERESLNVVSDQHGTPTNACDLAKFICKIINEKSNQYGIYHYTNEGVTTWYEFANEIKRIAIEKGKLEKDCRINPVSTDQYPTKAERPKYSVLSKNKVKSVFNIKIPQWEESLALFIESVPEKPVKVIVK